VRITIVIGGLGGGGAERVCVNLANAWVERGWEVTLLTVAQKEKPSVYPIDARVVRADAGWPRGLRDEEDTAIVLDGLKAEGVEELSGEAELMTIIRCAILDTAPDVVVSHMDLTNVRVIAALYGTGIPVVACEHTDPRRVPLGPWQRPREILYRKAQVVVASHDSTTEWLTRRGISATTIPNPLVPPRVYALKGVRKRVITLGRLAHEKRIELLIRAFARVAAAFPEWDLEIYGTGPLRGDLERVISLLKLEERAFLRGFTDDPYGALAGADLYVSASNVEGFGNAIWEALACGVPVVAMDCGEPVRTLVRNEIDGRVVSGGEDNLAIVLAALMGDEATRRRMAGRAREAAQRYPLEAVLRQWEAVLA
jgi:glycosyltransferase involved in cell wall biosynthesis